jgi:hypothetical protein
MKKELLMGTALVSTLGAASVAEAVTATMSGNHKTGLEFESPNSGTDKTAQINDNNFTVSLSETTDAGMTISSSFMLMNENGSSGDTDAGFTLAFTDGSKLDVINAGNASGSHDISIPASAGSEGISAATTNEAPGGLDFMTASTVYGVEYHTAADFMVDGLSMSFSASTDDQLAAASTYAVDGHFALGGTYVSSLGDSAVTVGFGYSQTEGAMTGANQMTNDEGGVHLGISAVTGDLTVAVGFADGDSIESTTTAMGVEWHSAADFLMDGLKMSASYSTDTGAAKAVTSRVENSWGVGATYVTSAGDTALTIGGGLSGSEVAVLDTQSGADDGGFTIGVSAVTGDLTVAVGFADGDTTRGVGSNTNIQVDADVLKAGVKYVSGDITMNLGVVSGTGTDNVFAGTDTKTDSHDEVNASVTYAVASGVSAILGYTSVDQNDEGASDDTGGSSWYVGATMSF